MDERVYGHVDPHTLRMSSADCFFDLVIGKIPCKFAGAKLPATQVHRISPGGDCGTERFRRSGGCEEFGKLMGGIIPGFGGHVSSNAP